MTYRPPDRVCYNEPMRSQRAAPYRNETPMLRVFPPDEMYHDTWNVIGDLRQDNIHDNNDIGTMVGDEARSRGLEFEADHESACSYFYVKDEATARTLAALGNSLRFVSAVVFGDTEVPA